MSGRAGPDCLTLWTADIAVARNAAAAGVDRIGVDLETLGKQSRQHGHSTWISRHGLSDLDRLRHVVGEAMLFARCNPLHPQSADEIASCLARGAKVLMLPNFTGADCLTRFVELVDGRAIVVPLVERVAAVRVIATMPNLGLSEFHVGLNDLSIELGMPNRLRVLAMPVLDEISTEAKAAGLRFGLGGLARAGDTCLPVPADLIYAQHARLGASGALIARSFHANALDERELAREVFALRGRLEDWRGASQNDLEAARDKLLALT